MSEIMSLAERKAVSPEVMGAATTPRIARMAPKWPRVVREMASTAHAGLLSLAARAELSSGIPPKKAIAMAAHMRAITLSEIIEP